MFVVGLTGGVGSGKSEAARLFAGLGVPVVDTDAIAHQLTAPGQPALKAIAEVFGSETISPDGTLDRNRLRRRVFAQPELRKALEGILHPLIRKCARQALAQTSSAPYQILVVPLLFETGGYADLISRSLVIDCDEALQIRRAMARSNLTEAEVRAVMAAQSPRERRLAAADEIIRNNGTLEELAAQVRLMHEKYIKACAASQSIP